MNFKHFLQDEGLVSLGKRLGKSLSYKGIHRLARVVAGINNLLPNSSMHRSIRSNLSVVLGADQDPKVIKQKSKETIRSLWFMHADYFYYYMHPEEGRGVLKFSPKMLEAMDDVKKRKIPTIMAGPHLGNFDLFGLSLAWQGLPVMALSVPNPNGAYNEQNKMRNEVGMNVVPIDMHSLRAGRKFLLEGNCLVTGIDRPVEDPANAKYRPRFFGKPAAVPVFYTRFGLEEGVRVRVGYVLRQEDGSYWVECSDPIPMQRYDDLQEEYEKNTERVLQAVEEVIRENAEQWLMLHPVWEVLLREKSKVR